MILQATPTAFSTEMLNTGCPSAVQKERSPSSGSTAPLTTSEHGMINLLTNLYVAIANLAAYNIQVAT